MNRADTVAWTGRRVLIALLLFFGLVAAVNAALVWFALQTWPGRSVHDAARDGRAPVASAAIARGPGEGDIAWTG